MASHNSNILHILLLYPQIICLPYFDIISFVAMSRNHLVGDMRKGYIPNLRLSLDGIFLFHCVDVIKSEAFVPFASACQQYVLVLGAPVQSSGSSLNSSKNKELSIFSHIIQNNLFIFSN